MEISRRDLLPDALFPIFWILIAFVFPAKISGIRKDIGLPENHVCRNTVQGRYLLSDDHGYVCSALSVDSLSRCCPEIGERFSCHGCNLVSQCCNSYEYCVSCCLHPSRTKEDLVLKVKIAKPITAGTYASVFDFCAGRCRHNSASVLNFSGIMELSSEARLTGIDIVIGKQGESCNSACRLKKQSCVPNRLLVLNKCEFLQRYMSCKGGCFASIGADQPAEVVDDAPKDVNPGACLFTQRETMLTCDGSHQHTRRLCPCA
uniref:SREBP regulating gene protein n=1 Tax=Elaeis guineensis var. tenera TaxID=51953 RepID=A0A6I9RP94_ELAGV|nr:uncharacterized protein LOC105051452 isoform X2 [Elaeis guineensis]